MNVKGGSNKWKGNLDKIKFGEYTSLARPAQKECVQIKNQTPIDRILAKRRLRKLMPFVIWCFRTFPNQLPKDERLMYEKIAQASTSRPISNEQIFYINKLYDETKQDHEKFGIEFNGF